MSRTGWGKYESSFFTFYAQRKTERFRVFLQLRVYIPASNRAFFITFASSAKSEFGFGELPKIENRVFC